MLKQIMIPVAAFAVTVTGASAFNSDMLENLDISLTDSEVAALEEVHELRGVSREEAASVLEDAGIDDERMQEIRGAMHEAKSEHKEAVTAAIEAGDYDAWLEVAGEGKMAEVITSEADFELLVEAHELRAAGDHEAAADIMAELGLERPEGGMKVGRGGHNGFGGPGHGSDRQSAETE